QADDLDRDAPCFQGLAQRWELGTLATQDSDVPGTDGTVRTAAGLTLGPGQEVGRGPGTSRFTRSGVHEPVHLLGDPFGFLDLAREQAGEDGAATTPGRTWVEDGHGGGLGTHGFGDSLGDLQDPLTVAKARGQAAYGRGTPRPHRKILRKIGEVRGDRPTPAVDGLAGITDRGDRVPFTEQSPQQN